jgi:transposase
LQALGYTGSYPSVRRKLQAWSPAKIDEAAVDQPKKRHQGIRRPSAKTVSWWLLTDKPAQPAEQQAFIEALHRLWPELGENLALVQEFSLMLDERDTKSLEPWVQLAEESTIFPEIRKFARVLRRDWAAVIEAVRGQWSSGQVEGQINRLKLIKREMYGRANFDLLRQRVLHSN